MADLPVTHTVHGVKFNRQGSCLRCGVCCVNDKCSHYKVINKLPTCTIYDKRGEPCKEHGGDTHEVCIKFPDHPWLKVIKDGTCSYTFTPVNISESSKQDNLNSVWQ